MHTQVSSAWFCLEMAKLSYGALDMFLGGKMIDSKVDTANRDKITCCGCW